MEMRIRGFRRKKSIRRLVELIKGETDAPITYHVVDAICDKLGLPVPSVKTVVERLKKAGFGACLTHFHSSGFKTDAPARIVKEAIARLV